MAKTKSAKRIGGSYRYASDLMQDVSSDTACVTHVSKVEYMSKDELLETIGQGIRDAIRNGGEE